MKQDHKKIVEAIHLARKFLPEGNYDHSLYATYLYAVRTHARGRLHMSVWNKHHPREMNMDPTQRWLEHPLSAGRVEFKSLEQQAQWIAYVREFIARRAASTYSSAADWKKLPLDFDAPEEVVPAVAQ